MEKKRDKKSFIYYEDWARQLLNAPSELRLKIDDAVKRYVLYGEEPEDKEVLFGMFMLMRCQIDRDRAKYDEVCERNAEKARKRWEKDRMQRHTTEYNGMQVYANDADNDNDNDNDLRKESKPKKRFSLPIPERKENFKKSMEPYRGKYSSDMLNEFYQYWAELNPSQTKMRFELQKTWETGKRLATWARKQDTFNKA